MGAPDAYAQIAMFRELNIVHLIDEWEVLDIHSRAQIIAQYQLNSMIELLRRHDQIIKENTERMTNKHKGKK